MTWAIPLLADPSPCLRWLVLTRLLHRGEDDPEVEELDAARQEDRLVCDLVRCQQDDGAWRPADLPGNVPGGALQATAHVLSRLGYLGFDRGHPPVVRGAAYLFGRQQDDGAWPLPQGRPDCQEDGYDMQPLQTAIPLRGLAACGFATDPRSERAFEWLLAQRLPDGAWPTGVAAGTYGYVAGYRRLAHSRWGCRANTTAAALCLALHPERRRSDAARRAVDLLLGRETRESHHVGYEVARLVGAEPMAGWLTSFARFDLGLVLFLCAGVGAGLDDPRVADLVAFVTGLRGPHGLWDYASQPQASRWVTYDLMRSLDGLAGTTDWQNQEPRTPFRAYLHPRRRY